MGQLARRDLPVQELRRHQLPPDGAGGARTVPRDTPRMARRAIRGGLGRGGHGQGAGLLGRDLVPSLGDPADPRNVHRARRVAGSDGPQPAGVDRLHGRADPQRLRASPVPAGARKRRRPRVRVRGDDRRPRPRAALPGQPARRAAARDRRAPDGPAAGGRRGRCGRLRSGVAPAPRPLADAVRRAHDRAAAGGLRRNPRRLASVRRPAAVDRCDDAAGGVAVARRPWPALRALHQRAAVGRGAAARRAVAAAGDAARPDGSAGRRSRARPRRSSRAWGSAWRSSLSRR